MNVSGYGCEVEWDGTTLVARGTNKMAHFALAGKGNSGDVLISADQIASVTLKAASALTNGNLTVTTTAGAKYVLNFRKNDASGFEALRAELPEAGVEQVVGLRADIETAKAKMRVKIGAGREIKKLEGYLWEGETVERLTAGQYGKGQGLVALTDRRLMFVQDGIMSKSSEDFPLDKMSSISWQSGVLMGSMVVYASGNKAEITNVQKDDGKEIVDLVRARLSAPKEQPQIVVQAAPVATAAPDAMDQLRKLADLHAAGVLTDDEFAAKKADLLDRM